MTPRQKLSTLIASALWDVPPTKPDDPEARAWWLEVCQDDAETVVRELERLGSWRQKADGNWVLSILIPGDHDAES